MAIIRPLKAKQGSIAIPYIDQDGFIRNAEPGEMRAAMPLEFWEWSVATRKPSRAGQIIHSVSSKTGRARCGYYPTPLVRTVINPDSRRYRKCKRCVASERAGWRRMTAEQCGWLRSVSR